MEISNRTIEALGKVITGDGGLSPYRSGPKLVSFFNRHGGNSLYGDGFPSRWKFAEEELQKLNRTAAISRVIEDALDPRHFMETEWDADAAVSYLNEFLAYDQFKVVKGGLFNRTTSTDGHDVDLPSFGEMFSASKGSHAFVLEQRGKSREKLEAKDYDGAITNARSMVEAVFGEIIANDGGEKPNCDGDLNKLYKLIKKQLNLDPNRKDLDDTLKQTLSGLNSIVTGIAGISNKMGDRHARKYKPERRHALLVINTSYALCEFLIATFECQAERAERGEGKP